MYARGLGRILFEVATDDPALTVDESVAELGSGLCLPPQSRRTARSSRTSYRRCTAARALERPFDRHSGRRGAGTNNYNDRIYTTSSVSLIAEFDAEAPFGGAAMERAPTTTLVREETDLTPDGHLRIVCRATGERLDAFETEMAADPWVADLSALTGDGERRVYAVRLTIPAEEAAYAALVDAGGQILSLEHDADGVHARVRCPSREAFVDLKDAWETRYGEFRVRGLYAEHGCDGQTLSPKQREALVVARDRGYFEVPRRATLSDLAAELGVSQQAISERLRRGTNKVMRALVEGTFGS